MKNKGVKRCLNIALVVVLGAFLATILMTVAYMLPVNSTIVTESMELLDKEGWYPLASVQKQELETYFHSYEPDVLDNSSDKVMITTALDKTAKGSAATRAMNAYSDYMGKNYAYYWHGYSMVLRPLMLFLNLAEIRVVNAIAQMLLLFLLAKLLWDKKGARYAVLVLSAYALLHPIALGKSLQFSWIFYIAIIGSIIAAKYTEALETNQRYLYLFTILGMATSFFDLLTYPLFTWGSVMVVFLLMSKEGTRVWQYLSKVILSGITWIVGYAGMWVMKWSIGSILTKNNIFESALFEVLFRTGVESDSNVQAFRMADRVEAFVRNLKHFDNKVYAIILIAWIAWIAILSLKRGITKSAKVPALFLVGLSSLVWYFSLANHTSIHHFFTYRILVVSYLAWIAIGIISTEKETVFGWKTRLQTMAIWVGFGVISSIVLFAFVRESVSISNGGFVPRHILLEEDGRIEVTFTPTFSGIREILLCAETISTEGYYQVTVSQNDAVLYVEQYDVSAFKETSFQTFEVDWDVKAGECYDIAIEAIDTNADVYAVITGDGKMPLAEYDNLRVNGVEYDSQPSSGFTYWCVPPSDWTKMLVVFATMGVFACVMVTVCSICNRKTNYGNDK